MPYKDLELEILKCEVVCANCHRHRTFMRHMESEPDRRTGLDC